AMIGSYVLAFQVLPRAAAGGPSPGSGVTDTVGVTALFAVSRLLAHRRADAHHGLLNSSLDPGRCLVGAWT
ncbi:MAG TPA: hypothetical protein VJ757_07210, partial [Pseudonocardiaceae bacterium]|nr:hypothetical protein [Pseudonocardiaceae bacterium]